MLIKLASCEVVEGALYNAMGEDEMLTCFDHRLVATDTTGREWVHHHRFAGTCEDDEGITRPNMRVARQEAEALALEVRRKGVINPEYWTICDKGMSLEERWQAFGYEYQLEHEEAGIR